MQISRRFVHFEKLMTPIDSTWTKLIVEWASDGYLDPHEEVIAEHPQVYMKLEPVTDWQGNTKEVLRFVGGPIKPETYYVEKLLDPVSGLKTLGKDTLCICRGSYNFKPRCEVPIDQVLKFLETSSKA